MRTRAVALWPSLRRNRLPLPMGTMSTVASCTSRLAVASGNKVPGGRCMAKVPVRVPVTRHRPAAGSRPGACARRSSWAPPFQAPLPQGASPLVSSHATRSRPWLSSAVPVKRPLLGSYKPVPWMLTGSARRLPVLDRPFTSTVRSELGIEHRAIEGKLAADGALDALWADGLRQIMKERSGMLSTALMGVFFR